MKPLVLVRGICLGLWIVALVVSGCEKAKPELVRVEAPRGQDEVRAVVGKEGGELSFPDGGARLEIPTGLLNEEVTVTFRREAPTFDLSGKDTLGKAYRISPRLSFAPGAAKLYVPIDRELPGLPEEIGLMVYFFDRKLEEGPAGPSAAATWIPHPLTKFAGFSPDQKFLVFWIYESISERTTKPPYGVLQAAFDLPK